MIAVGALCGGEALAQTPWRVETVVVGPRSEGLRQRDPETRAGAAAWLGRGALPGDSQGLARLAAVMLQERDLTVRVAEIQSLLEARPLGWEQLLLALWQRTQALETRTETGVGGTLRDREPVYGRVLLSALACVTAAPSTEALGDPDGPPVTQRVRGSHRSYDALLAPLTETASGDSLDDPDTLHAARLLATMPEARVAAIFERANPSVIEQVLRLRVLALRGDPRALPVCEALLATSPEPDERLRRAALDAVVWLRASELAPRVLAYAEATPSRALRARALAALGQLGGGFDAMSLVPFLDDPMAAGAALDALAALGDPRVAPALVARLSARWSRDRAAAARALRDFDLGSVSEALAQRALAEPEAAVRRALVDALAQQQNPVARARLATLDAPEAALARGLVARASGQGPGDDTGDAAAVAGFRAANTEAERVNRALRLAARDTTLAREALVGWIEAVGDDPDDAALAAAVALSDRGLGLERDRLARWSRHPRARARAAAAYLLGASRLGQNMALRALLRVEPEPTVLHAAAMALARAEGPAAFDALGLLRGVARGAETLDALTVAAAMAQSGQVTLAPASGWRAVRGAPGAVGCWLDAQGRPRWAGLSEAGDGWVAGREEGAPIP